MLLRYFIHNIMFHEICCTSGRWDLPKYTTKCHLRRTTKQTSSGNTESSNKIQSWFVFAVLREISNVNKHGQADVLNDYL